MAEPTYYTIAMPHSVQFEPNTTASSENDSLYRSVYEEIYHCPVTGDLPIFRTITEYLTPEAVVALGNKFPSIRITRANPSSNTDAVLEEDLTMDELDDLKPFQDKAGRVWVVLHVYEDHASDYRTEGVVGIYTSLDLLRESLKKIRPDLEADYIIGQRCCGMGGYHNELRIEQHKLDDMSLTRKNFQ